MPVTHPIILSPAQARVLGALVEKEVTTPDYYPLSLNALVNACNQLTNREPVMHLDDEEAHLALRRLEDLGLAAGLAAPTAESPNTNIGWAKPSTSPVLKLR